MRRYSDHSAPYFFSAPDRVFPMEVDPPCLGNLDVSGPTLANMIPYSAHPETEIPNAAARALNFYGERKGLGRPRMVVEYLKVYPETPPNSAKIPAGRMGIYLSNDVAPGVPIIYFPHSGWFAYDVFRKEQGEGKLELTQIPPTRFVGCISNCLSLSDRRNIFKQTRRWTSHHWRKFPHDLEITPSNANQ